MGEKDKPSYYAIIPANVRYDERLPANAKLLYGEITALCNARGCCWATNEYFAELYDTTERSVSNWIAVLVECGYIESKVEYDREKQKSTRSLFIGGVEKNFLSVDGGVEKIFYGGVEKNFQQNNTRYNNITSNIENKKEIILSKDNIIKKKEKIGEVIDYLNEKTGSKYKANTADTVKHINARLAEGFTVDDFKKVIDNKTAEWLGTEMAQYLRPATLFGTKFESYLNTKPRTRTQQTKAMSKANANEKGKKSYITHRNEAANALKMLQEL